MIMLQINKKLSLSSNNITRTSYWNNLNFYFRSYKLFNLNLNQSLKPKVKSYKRIANKSKLVRSVKIVKIHLPFQLFTATPPLSTTLNSLGIQSSKFIEEFNLYFSKLFENNNRVILKIFFYRNMSYSIHCKVNETSILKNMDGLKFLNDLNSANVAYLNSFLRNKSFGDFLTIFQNNPSIFYRLDDQQFINRLFTFHDIFMLTNYLYFYKDYINSFNWGVNQKLSEIPMNLTDGSILLNFESILNSIMGTIKSFQNQNSEDLNFLKILKYKSLTKR